jgi:hypothetical protein|tara:strand:+ start:43 stop:648 length:606 start_codon:yes stop_codon:yes gene_type:complete
MIKELNIEPYTKSLKDVGVFLDNFEFKKVKTKYTKGDDWTAISFHGYGNHPLDILKPGVLKSSVKIDTKLQYTSLINLEEMKPILEILQKLPCTYERVRFMKLVKGKVIGKHSDKIDKDIESKKIIRIHIPIRTNKDVIFTLYESSKDKQGQDHNLKTGHFYYTDVSKPHAVQNNSNEDRIHLVVDCVRNTQLSTLLSVIA